ncbi:MAG: GNAT family N-acetyltransferase [Wenzhouxiangella sp.]|jgi:GNAT superfamily N-acetyltransferase|nr:GNAT family N-acetyltransferase [Wenzhouxiangella sp.]
MALQVKSIRGAEATPWLDAVANLRIRIFRDFPYLYDGSLDYERGYLAEYAASPDSVIVLALNNQQLVGCSTGLPMADAEPAFRQPFIEAGFALEKVFYFGESVLEAVWRGHGVGHQFFDQREAHAEGLGFSITTFCAVQRSSDHPLRPAAYRPLDAFWSRRGYRPRPDLITHFGWKDIDQAVQTDKPMQFWVRDGSATAG